MQDRVRGLVSEPLFWFVALGSLVFALDRAVRDTGPESDPVGDSAQRSQVDAAGRRCTPLERSLKVTPLVTAELAKNFERAIGRAPTDEELSPMIDRWIDEEIFFREGVELGLDHDDAVIRRRVADKMGAVIAARSPIDPPSEAELLAYYQDHADEYGDDARIDLQHVFFEATRGDSADRAEATLELLQSGSNPAGLGDRFSGGRRYRKRTLAQLEEIFGSRFTDQLETEPLGAWTLRTSKYGIHLVQVTARGAARPSDFASERLRVEQDWFDAREAELAAQAARELKARWTISRP